MKSAAAVILIFLFSVQTFSKWVWVFNYQLNKTYIAANLCINKEKPQLHCNGKCQLSKKLAEDEKNDNTSGTASPKQESNFLFIKQDLQPLVPTWRNSAPSWGSHYAIKPYAAPHAAVFHPPAV